MEKTKPILLETLQDPYMVYNMLIFSVNVSQN